MLQNTNLALADAPEHELAPAGDVTLVDCAADAANEPAAALATVTALPECTAADARPGTGATETTDHAEPALHIEAGAPERPVIRIEPGQLRVNLALAQRYLAASGAYFERSGMIVRLHRDSLTGEVSIRDMNIADLVRSLDEVAAWERLDKRSGAWLPADPPERFCAVLMRSGATEHLSPLAGLARQPYLRADGSLCATPGYDPVTKLYGAFDPKEFNVPSPAPTRAEAEAAYGRLDTLLTEFPWASASDRSAALAAMLTAAVRPTLVSAPMFHVRAHAAGTGKSYLAALIGSFATPQLGSPLAFPGSNDECEKVLLAELARGPAVIEFDNLTGDILPFKKLCTVLTSEQVSGRLLGTSRTLKVSTRALILSSGNNVGPVADMARRCVTIDLDTPEEIPASRGFSTPDLLESVRRQRASYVIDALTVIGAWMAAGSPATTCRPLNSYGQWSQWCRQPLMWLGCADPAMSVFQTMSDDPDRESLGQLLAGWSSRFGSDAIMVRDLIEWGSGLDPACRDFRDLLIDIAGERDTVNRRRLGWWVKRHAGQVVHGMRIMKAPRTRNAEAWKVVSV